MRTLRTALALVATAALVACGGGDDDEPAAGTTTTTSAAAPDTTGTTEAGGTDGSTATTAAEPATDLRVLSLGEEYVLADLLALGIRPVHASANIVVDGGFHGLDEFDTEGIEASVSFQPNVEALAALDADVVVTTGFFAGEFGDVLNGLADEVVVLPDGDAQGQLLAIGDAFDRRAEAEALIAELDAAIADGQAVVAELPEERRRVSVATIYSGPSVAAWVAGPIDVPDTLLDLGFTIDPDSEDVEGEDSEDGRVFLSPEQIGILDSPTILTLQTDFVDGEAEAIAAMDQDPLWTTLPAVTAGRLLTVDRLGYPGIAGRIRLVADLLELLAA